MKTLVLFFATLMAFGQDNHHANLTNNIFDAERGPTWELTQNDQMPLLLVEVARQSGLHLLSSSSRHSRDSSERIYLGYDAELSSLLTFFDLLDERLDYKIETLNISARRVKQGQDRKRSALNGNMILMYADPAKDEASDLEPTKKQFANLLTDITQALPADTHLKSLILKRNGKVQILGQAQDMERLNSALKQIPWVTGITEAEPPSNEPNEKPFFLYRLEIAE